jgi:hypothetical protein
MLRFETRTFIAITMPRKKYESQNVFKWVNIRVSFDIGKNTGNTENEMTIDNGKLRRQQKVEFSIARCLEKKLRLAS